MNVIMDNAQSTKNKLTTTPPSDVKHDVLSTPLEGYFFGHYQLSSIPYIGDDTSKKCFVFSGQGSVKPGMFSEHYQSNDVIRARFDKADLLAQARGLPKVSDFIVTPKTLEKDQVITTRILCLLTLEIAIYEYLRSIHCHPTLITSHSFGDLAALVASGIVDFETMFDIVHHREKCSPPEHSLGYLLVAYAGHQQCIEAMPDERYHIANINSPNETAISVTLSEIKNVRARLKEHGIKTNILRSVPHPYHSQSMLPLHNAMADYLTCNTPLFKQPDIPFYSCTIKKTLTKDNFCVEDAHKIISRNVIEQIDFVTQVRCIHDIGIKHFIEIGPTPVCSSFINTILNPHTVKSDFSGSWINKDKTKLRKVTDETTKKILSSINRTIGKVTGYEIDQISIEDKFQEELGIDSLKKVEIIVSILEEYNISSDHSKAISDFETIEDTIEFIKKAQHTDSSSENNIQRMANFSRQTPRWIQQNNCFIVRSPVASALSDNALSDNALSDKTPENIPILELENIQSSIDYVHTFYQQHWSTGSKKQLIIRVTNTGTTDDIFLQNNFSNTIKTALYPCLVFLQSLLTLSKSDQRFIYISSETNFSSGGSNNNNNPIAEALLGYLLAASKEQNTLSIKLLEFDRIITKPHLLRTAIEEQYSIEQHIRFTDSQRWISTLESASSTNKPLPDNPIIVALGGAKGITHALLESLADTHNLHLYIAGRSKNDDPLVIQNIEKIQQSDIHIHYTSIDATDLSALMVYMETITTRHGKIDVLMNGVGVVNVSMLEDKTEEDFDYEFFHKTQPAYNCLTIAKELPVSHIINFSSVLGRFGGAGQTFYCAANALINSLVTQFNCQENTKTATALCWPPWDNTGMTANTLVRKQLHDLGLSLLNQEVACELFRTDLQSTHGGSVYYFDKADHSRYFPSAQQTTELHSLIGRPTGNLTQGFRYQKSFQLTGSDHYLTEHLVSGTPYVPAATIISMCYAMSRLHFGADVTLANIDIISPIIVNNTTPVRLHGNIQADCLDLSLHSSLLHANMSAQISTPLDIATTDIPTAVDDIDLTFFYASKEQAAQRVYHGPCFRLIRRAYTTNNNLTIFEINIDKAQNIINNSAFSRLILLLDNAFQAMGIIINRKVRASALPNKMGHIHFLDNVYTPVVFAVPHINNVNDKECSGNITIYNSHGEPILIMADVIMSIFGQQKKSWGFFNN